MNSSRSRSGPIDDDDSDPLFNFGAVSDNVEQTRSCEMKFVSYTPSLLEKRWTANIGTWQNDVCQYSNQEAAEIDKWVDYTSKTLRRGPYEEVHGRSSSPLPASGLGGLAGDRTKSGAAKVPMRG